MILGNTEIVRCLHEGLFSINPLKHMDPEKKPFNTSAIDLHLENQILVPETGSHSPFQIDPEKGKVADFLSRHSKRVLIEEEHPYSLKNGRFILASTCEWVSFPVLPEKSCYAARVEGRSSLARYGVLVHFTAPTIHAGFEGKITLEIINLGNYGILLSPGMAICQLIIEEVKGCPVDAPNQFKGQEKPEGVPRHA